MHGRLSGSGAYRAQQMKIIFGDVELSIEKESTPVTGSSVTTPTCPDNVSARLANDVDAGQVVHAVRSPNGDLHPQMRERITVERADQQGFGSPIFTTERIASPSPIGAPTPGVCPTTIQFESSTWLRPLPVASTLRE